MQSSDAPAVPENPDQIRPDGDVNADDAAVADDSVESEQAAKFAETESGNDLVDSRDPSAGDPTDSASAELYDEAIESDPEPSDETDAALSTVEELEAIRIRHVVVMRRTAYRTLSYMVCGAVACAVGAVQAIVWAVDAKREVGWTFIPIMWIIIAIGLLFGLAEFIPRVRRLRKNIAEELEKRKQEELEMSMKQPDFSLLSDGTHHAKNLEMLASGGSELNEATNVTKELQE